MKILAIEASTKNISISLNEGQILHQEIQLSINRENTGMIAQYIEEILKNNNCPKEKIDYIVCDIGPGYFTTLRSSLAICQGLSLVWDTPIIPVCSLDILHEASYSIQDKIALIHSTQNSFFYRIYKNGMPSQPPSLAKIDAIIEQYPTIVKYVTSDEQELCHYQKISNRTIIPQKITSQSMIQFFLRNFLQIRPLQYAWELQPLYLRPSRAEENTKV